MSNKEKLIAGPEGLAAIAMVDCCSSQKDIVQEAYHLQDIGLVDAGNRLMKVAIMRSAEGRTNQTK